MSIMIDSSTRDSTFDNMSSRMSSTGPQAMCWDHDMELVFDDAPQKVHSAAPETKEPLMLPGLTFQNLKKATSACITSLTDATEINPPESDADDELSLERSSDFSIDATSESEPIATPINFAQRLQASKLGSHLWSSEDGSWPIRGTAPKRHSQDFDDNASPYCYIGQKDCLEHFPSRTAGQMLESYVDELRIRLQGERDKQIREIKGIDRNMQYLSETRGAEATSSLRRGYDKQAKKIKKTLAALRKARAAIAFQAADDDEDDWVPSLAWK